MAPAPTATDEATRAAQAAAEAAKSAAEATHRLADTADRIAAALGAAPPPAVAAERPRPPSPSAGRAPSAWAIISLTGNANTLTLTGNAAAEYRTADWVASAKASGAYGTSAAPNVTERTVVAEAAAGSLRGERRFTPLISGYGQFGAETNHLASLELRTAVELGLGITFIELKVNEKERAFLRTDLAVRYSHDYRFQYYPTKQNLDDLTLLAPGAGVTFRYAVNEAVTFSQTAEILPNILGSSRILFNATSKLTTRLWDNLAVNVAFAVVHDSAPARRQGPHRHRAHRRRRARALGRGTLAIGSTAPACPPGAGFAGCAVTASTSAAGRAPAGSAPVDVRPAADQPRRRTVAQPAATGALGTARCHARGGSVPRWPLDVRLVSRQSPSSSASGGSSAPLALDVLPDAFSRHRPAGRGIVPSMFSRSSSARDRAAARRGARSG